MLRTVKLLRSSGAQIAFEPNAELQDAVYPPRVLRTEFKDGSFAAGTPA